MRRVVGKISPSGSAAAATGPYLAERYTYDSDGQLTRTEFGYLAAWQSETVLPNDWTGFTVTRQVDLQYDLAGNKIREIVSSGGTPATVTQFSYDSAFRLQCTAVRMNLTSLPADACALGAAGTQGNDRITRNVYDAAGQVVQVRRAVGTGLEQAYTTTSYTANGKQDYVIDANGNRARLTYDGFDRQTRWTFSSATAPTAYNPATQATALASAGALNAADYEEYGYDASGNRTSLRKRDGSIITYQYDPLNRNTAKIVPERAGLAATHTRDVYYGYDLRGLQTYARFDSATGEGITNNWDGLGRLTSTTQTMDGASRTISYLYDANGNRLRETFPDLNYVTYAYDGLNRPTFIRRSGSATLASYTYNSLGQRDGFGGAVATSYAYDSVGRLQTLTNTPAYAADANQWSFGYNPASQIVQATRSNDMFAYTGRYNVNRAYSVNGLNQYTAAGPATFGYDPNGNLTGDGTSTYGYDIENRLVSKGGGSAATLRYDPLGRLYEVAAATGATRFLNDGDALAAEYDTSGTLLRRYVHGADLKADDPIAWYEGAAFTAANERQLRPDWQGSIVLVTDASGNRIGINRYDEYGVPQCPLAGGALDCTAPGSNLGRFQYTGQAWLAEIGLYYYKARI